MRSRLLLLALLLSMASPAPVAARADHEGVPPTGWALRSLRDGLRVEAATVPEGTWIRVSREVAAPIGAVCRVLTDLGGYHAWFPGLEESEVLERGPSSAIVYGRLGAPWPLQDRDYVVTATWTRGDGVFGVESRSTPRAERPPTSDVVRLRSVASAWTAEAREGRTRVSYVYLEPGEASWFHEMLVRQAGPMGRRLLANLEGLSEQAGDVSATCGAG